MIDIKLFREEYTKIEAKLEEISKIPKLWGDGGSFEGIEIDDEGILYKSADHYNGCSPDFYSFHIKWDELNNPIEYFKEKYALEIDNDKKRKEDKKNIEQLEKDKRDLAEYKRLQNKFGNNQ